MFAPVSLNSRVSRWLVAAALAVSLTSTLVSAASSQCLDLNPYGPLGYVPQFIVDDVIFREGIIPAGGGAGIGLDLAYPFFPASDPIMDVVIPWSDPQGPGGAYAHFEFGVSFGQGVDLVEFDATHQFNYMKITAYDANNVPVGPTQVHTAGPGNLQHYVFGAAGQQVKRVEFAGAEIVVTDICYQTGSVVGGGGTAPLSKCIDIPGLPLGLTASVLNVDEVLFYRAILPTGASVDPVVRDRFAPGADGVAEINFDWSQTNSGGAQFAFIYFPATKFGTGPNKVEITVAHTNQADFVAYDATGAAVANAVHPGPQDAWRTLVLTSATGIRRIDIIGAELGIQQLCYDTFTRTGCVDAVAIPYGTSTHMMTIDKVEFEAAFDPTGVPLLLSMTDNLLAGTAPDGTNEMFFGWSLPAGRTARIRFPAADFFLGPSTVEVVCAASTTLDLVAYDASGGVVDMKSVTVPPLQLQTLTLSGGNIREIELIGTQFWVQELCWKGPYDLSTPAPSAASSARAQLFAPSPNPFNPRTHLRFRTEVAGPVELDVFDLRGRHVRTLMRGQREAGDHQALWDGTDDTGMAVASGAYLVRLQAAGEVRMQRAALLK
jgi:FlgD Ig-like domain